MIPNTLISKPRTRLEIIANILECASEGQITKSAIMYKTTVSISRLSRYLPALVENQLLKYDPSERRYAITEKGRSLLDLYNQSKDLLKMESMEVKHEISSI